MPVTTTPAMLASGSMVMTHQRSAWPCWLGIWTSLRSGLWTLLSRASLSCRWVGLSWPLCDPLVQGQLQLQTGHCMAEPHCFRSKQPLKHMQNGPQCLSESHCIAATAQVGNSCLQEPRRVKDTYAAGEGSGEEAPKVSQLCSDSMLLSRGLCTSWRFPSHAVCVFCTVAP